MTGPKKATASGRDRRQHRRASMKIMVNYKSVKKDQVSSLRKSHSQDLSAGGLGMHSISKLQKGQMLAVELFIPRGKKQVKAKQILDFSQDKCHTTPILCRVVYCAPTRNSKYKLGIQFLDLDKENRKVLRDFLLQCQLIKPASRLYT